MPSIYASTQHKNAVYSLLLDRIECGPFDGGCLIFAQALQRIHGGELFVVEGRSFSGWDEERQPQYKGELRAQHAVVKLPGGNFIDADGEVSESAMLKRAGIDSRLIASAERLRPYAEGDLMEAARDPALVERLTELLLSPPARTRRPR